MHPRADDGILLSGRGGRSTHRVCDELSVGYRPTGFFAQNCASLKLRGFQRVRVRYQLESSFHFRKKSDYYPVRLDRDRAQTLAR